MADYSDDINDEASPMVISADEADTTLVPGPTSEENQPAVTGEEQQADVTQTADITEPQQAPDENGEYSVRFIINESDEDAAGFEGGKTESIGKAETGDTLANIIPEVLIQGEEG